MMMKTKEHVRTVICVVAIWHIHNIYDRMTLVEHFDTTTIHQRYRNTMEIQVTDKEEAWICI